MNNIFNKVIDILLTAFSRISVLLIVLILGLIIFGRIDKLFNMDLIGNSLTTHDGLMLNNSNEEILEETGPADIIYEGNIKPSDSASAISAVNSAEDGENLVAFEINEGKTPHDVATLLQEKGLIQDIYTFISLLENSNLQDRIIPGSYKVPENIKNIELIESITIPPDSITETDMTTELVSFEITSEHSLNDVTNILENKGFIQDPPSFILLLEEKNLMESINLGVYRLPKDIKNADLIEAITTPISEN